MSLLFFYTPLITSENLCFCYELRSKQHEVEISGAKLQIEYLNIHEQMEENCPVNWRFREDFPDTNYGYYFCADKQVT